MVSSRTRPTPTSSKTARYRVRGGCGRPGGVRMCRICRGCRWRPAPVGRTFTTPDGKTYRPSMFLTLDPAQLRQSHQHRGRVEPGQLRLPPWPLGCAAFSEAAGPVLGEPAPLRRLQGAVLLHPRTATTPRPARPRSDPRFHPAAGCLKQVIAATYVQLWWPGSTRPVYDSPCWADRVTSIRPADTSSRPAWGSVGPSRATNPTIPVRRMWSGSGSRPTCKASSPASRRRPGHPLPDEIPHQSHRRRPHRTGRGR